MGKLLSPEFYNYLIIAVSCLVGVFWLSHPSKINKVLFVGYYIRLAIAFVAYFDLYPIEGSRSDALFFIEEAEKIFSPSIFEIVSNYAANPIDFYPLVIAIIYLVFGQSAFLLVFINVILSTLIIRNVYWFTQKIHTENCAKVTAKIVTILPYSIMFGVTVIREPMITFFLTYFFVLLSRKDFSNSSLILMLISLAMLTMLHGAFALFTITVLLYFALSVFIEKRSFKDRMIVSVMSVTIVIGGYFMLTNFEIYKLRAINPEASSEIILNSVFNSAGYSIKGSSYRDEVKITNLGDVFTNYGGVVVPFIFQPYFFRVIELKTYVILFLGSIPWHILALLAIIYFSSFFKIFRNNLKYIILIGSLATIFAFGSSQLNQAIRHNHKFLPLVVGIMSPLIVRNKYLAGAFGSNEVVT